MEDYKDYECYMSNRMFVTAGRSKSKPKPIKKGNIAITEAKPRMYQFHYSVPESDGALANETVGFPNQYNPKTHKFTASYSDRLQSWDSDNFNKVCKMFGTGDQCWAQKSQNMTNEGLLEVAQLALKLPCKPTHARVVHHLNASSGYSCPTIEAIYKIKKDKKEG